MAFLYYFPLEKGVAIHLNKLESPLNNNALCQLSLIEISPVIQE